MAKNDQRTEHWWRVTYGLKCVRKGLQYFVDRKTRLQHINFYNNVRRKNGYAFAVCRTCQLNKNCLNGVFKISKNVPNTFCSRNFCDSFLDDIISTYFPYTRTGKKPIWVNTDSTQWGNEQLGYWEVAKCFLGCPTSSNKEGPNQMDASGLINICLNNTDIRTCIANARVFEEVREIRNKIFHSASFKLDEQTADDYLEKMIELLNDAKELQNDCFAIEHRRCLVEIKAGKKTISDKMKTSIQTEVEVSANEVDNVEETLQEPYNMFKRGRMSDERIQFTAKLVKLYPWIKYEMEKTTALTLENNLSPKAFSRDTDEVCQMSRRSVVDDCLKRVIFSSCTTIHEQFQANLTNVQGGSKIAEMFESCQVTDQDIEKCQSIQQRRTEKKFEFNRHVQYLVMSNPSLDTDIIVDHLLSSYLISLEEHSNIVQTENKDTKVYLFMETVSRCDKSVLRVLKAICLQLQIQCILYGDEEVLERGHTDKSTAEAVLSDSKLKYFSRLGLTFKSKQTGSIIFTFDCTAFALSNLKQECKNGNIIHFLEEILADENVLKTIPNGHHSAHVEIRRPNLAEIIVIISGTIFLERSQICHKHDNDVPQHDVYICEELEVTQELITQLRDEFAIPANIAFERFESIEGRRERIHFLLRLCRPSFDFGNFNFIISRQNANGNAAEKQPVDVLYTCDCKITRENKSTVTPVTCELSSGMFNVEAKDRWQDRDAFPKHMHMEHTPMGRIDTLPLLRDMARLSANIRFTRNYLTKMLGQDQLEDQTDHTPTCAELQLREMETQLRRLELVERPPEQHDIVFGRESSEEIRKTIQSALSHTYEPILTDSTT